jgi:hypothetical protein
MYEIINRFNNNIDELNDVILKGYNIKVEEKFVFFIDSFGMKILGKQKSNNSMLPVGEASTEWTEYYLDFGKELTTESQLNSFLLEFHH